MLSGSAIGVMVGPKKHEEQETQETRGNYSQSRMAADKSSGLVEIPSSHSVAETVEKLKGILQANGITLFAFVDHSGEAEKAGLKMRPTKLLIFGNPKAGTSVMLAAPSSAIDLPLKILIWEDAQREGLDHS